MCEQCVAASRTTHPGAKPMDKGDARRVNSVNSLNGPVCAGACRRETQHIVTRIPRAPSPTARGRNKVVLCVSRGGPLKLFTPFTEEKKPFDFNGLAWEGSGHQSVNQCSRRVGSRGGRAVAAGSPPVGTPKKPASTGNSSLIHAPVAGRGIC